MLSDVSIRNCILKARAVDFRRRVAVVVPKYGLVGGAEGHTAELTDRIAGDGHYDVHVFANRWTNHNPGITFHRVPIVTFPKFLTTPSFACFAGLAMSMGPSFDLIHTHADLPRAHLHDARHPPPGLGARCPEEGHESF